MITGIRKRRDNEGSSVDNLLKKADNHAMKRVLGIETSCDETSVALLECGKNGSVRIKAHEIATQIPIHARYGGVVPEVAARTHVAEVIALLERVIGLSPVLKKKTPAMRKREMEKIAGKFDAIAVTRGPGLATALRIGIEAGKTLAWAYQKPLIPVNHLEGHLASAWLTPNNRKHWEYPILFLLVSGGHTELVVMKKFGSYRVIGRTRDDASGEAFDKTAKLLGMEYPGGPKLAKLAKEGRADAFKLPRPMLRDPSLDFSFSGLKTAVRQTVEQAGKITPRQKKDLCASIQEAIVDVLVAKTMRAVKRVKPKAIAVVGGVSANTYLQERMRQAIKETDAEARFLEPVKGLHTDNGAMIAAAGWWNLQSGKSFSKWQNVDADPELDL